jgi:exopolysaccharide biosynthesis polyprenyl glycosylphosphotransferase
MLADAVALGVGLVAAFVAQRVLRPVPAAIMAEHSLLIVASLPAFALGAVMNRLYHSRANARLTEEAANVLRAVAVGVGFTVLLGFSFKYGHLSRLWVFLVAVCAFGAVILERYIVRRVFARLRAEGRLSRRIVIVGTDANAIGMLHTYIRNPGLGYRVVGFVGDDDIGTRAGVEVLGGVAELDRILVETQAIGVVISLSSVGTDQVNHLTRRLTDDGYHVALSSSLTDIDITRLRPQQLDGRTMLYIEPVIRHGWRWFAKRTFDVGLASLILLVSAPFWLIAAVAIRIDSRGPILYRQTRVGRHGQLFTMAKLRTMVVDADELRADLSEQNEADGPLFKISKDPRVTRVGRILRRTSFDEMPQLVSVLRGDMSMVGPRPALPDEVEHWDDALRDRLRVLPGLTGMWQVSGRADTSFEQYKRLDLYYVDNWSLAHDLRICARTVAVVLTGRGAS